MFGETKVNLFQLLIAAISLLEIDIQSYIFRRTADIFMWMYLWWGRCQTRFHTASTISDQSGEFTAAQISAGIWLPASYFYLCCNVHDFSAKFQWKKPIAALKWNNKWKSLSFTSARYLINCQTRSVRLSLETTATQFTVWTKEFISSAARIVGRC